MSTSATRSLLRSSEANRVSAEFEAVYNQVFVPENQGPSVGFRLYNPEWVTDADAEFNYESLPDDSDTYRERLRRNSQWHRGVFRARGRIGLYTNWVELIAHSEYDDRGRCLSIPGEKAVFMNPLTTRKQVDLFIDNLR